MNRHLTKEDIALVNRLEKMFIKNCLVAKLCPTICNPMDYSPPDSCVHGIFQARILEWVAYFLLQGILPTEG